MVAARRHAEDMVGNGLDHRGSDGSTPDVRVAQAGYEWTAVAENLAVGPREAETVASGWMASPPHRQNLLGGVYLNAGAAVVAVPGSPWGTYWVMVYATSTDPDRGLACHP